MNAVAAVPRRGQHCLVVDDDAVFAEVVAAALGRRGFEVSVALDAAGALAAAEHAPPSHALIDLRLGVESGLHVVAWLHERYPQARIVVLTGYASIATAVEAIKLGAMHYLTKPTDADAIVAAFDRGAGDPDVAPVTHTTPLERLEWEHIQQVLSACDGNVSRAAARLGLHRRTLQRKLQKRPSGLR